MASITKEKSGAYRLKFLDGHKTIGIRLGTRDKKAAISARAFVEALITAKKLGVSPDGETVAWLNRLDDVIHARIAKAGLTTPRQAQQKYTLKTLIEKFQGTLSVKPSTEAMYRHTGRNLLAYLTDRPLTEITNQNADEFRVWLKQDQKLAEATTGRRIVAARTIFTKGQRWGMINANPFTGVKGGQQANKARQRIITVEETRKLMDACPDALWRLIIALARFGGVRVPSEILPLKWCDVNWEHRTIRITSPKTEHHAGGGTRLIPLFPELEGPLLDCQEQAQDGEVFIIQRYQGKSLNLRTQLDRIIQKAGLEVWPKPFQNMRATRQTELSDDKEVGPYDACKIMGNSLRVAEPHYLIDNDQQGRINRALKIKTGGPISGPVMAQKAAQTATDKKSTESTKPQQTLDHQGLCQSMSTPDVCSHVNPLRPAGVEPATFGSVDRRSIQLSYERMSMCFPAPLTNSSLSSTRAEKQGFDGTFSDNRM